MKLTAFSHYVVMKLTAPTLPAPNDRVALSGSHTAMDSSSKSRSKHDRTMVHNPIKEIHLNVRTTFHSWMHLSESNCIADLGFMDEALAIQDPALSIGFTMNLHIQDIPCCVDRMRQMYPYSTYFYFKSTTYNKFPEIPCSITSNHPQTTSTSLPSLAP